MSPNWESPTTPFLLKSGIGLFHADGLMVQNIVQVGSPYIIEDCRLVMVKKGSGIVSINMREQHIKESTLLFFGLGCIVHPLKVSPDIEMYGMMLSEERLGIVSGSNVSTPLAGHGDYLVMETTQEEMSIVDTLFSLIWKLLHKENCPEEMINGLLFSMLHYSKHLGLYRTNKMREEKSRNRYIFDSFIDLINIFCKEERSLSFYADKLCITARYLGVLVKNCSGVTAKEWIDRAVATNAMVMLRHGNKQIIEISDELHFANPSFFCKFFKRMTGVTPQQYRQGS